MKPTLFLLYLDRVEEAKKLPSAEEKIAI